MSYAALMVHLGAHADWQGRVRLTVDLAHRFDAALIAIAGWLSSPAFAIDDIAADQDTTDAEGRQMAARLAEMGEKFRAAARHVSHVEWRGMLDYPRTMVPREARAADLLIIGRDRVAGDPYFSLNPGNTILRAGRPVLVVPDGIDALAAKRVVVAWKDTRESRRAVSDALPFLRRADAVLLVEICEFGAEVQSEQRMSDVGNYLARHQVTVAAKAFLHTERPVAEELLRFAGDEGADLIVSGAYGHSRLGEWIFGGVTRDLLAASPICCLFSH
jgi:nucleotide-binding universal stress UspA family protein